MKLNDFCKTNACSSIFISLIDVANLQINFDPCRRKTLILPQNSELVEIKQLCDLFCGPARQEALRQLLDGLTARDKGDNPESTT